MTAAITVITDSLKELGVLAEGDTPSASMASDALRALNRVVEVLSNGASFAYYPSLAQRALTGESSFTIGPTGNVAVARPIGIETATVDRDGVTYPVRVVDSQIFDSITVKGVTGANTVYIWYEPTLPNGIVHCWPLATGCTLNMRTVNVVASFADLTTDVPLPPGYEECLISNLAIRLAPQYPAGVLSPITVQMAKTSLATIKKTNRVIPTMTLPGAVTGRSQMGSYANFISGVY